MNIETFKVFCDLADLRSFSKAAEKHLLSQSAISQQLAQLELVHKSQLIDRKKRPIELTKTGQLFYDACKDIIERYEQLRSDLTELQQNSLNRLNVAAIYSIGMHALADYIKRFMLKYPQVNLRVEYFSPDTIYQRVLTGEIDIGVVAVPKRDKRLEVFDCQDEPLVFVCSPKHHLARQTQIDIHQIQFEKFIAFEEGVPTRQWIDGIFHRYNIVVRPLMEFDNVETTKRAVELNSGVSILPLTVLTQELASKTLIAIPFSNENFIRPTGIIIRKNKILSPAGKYFIELLVNK